MKKTNKIIIAALLFTANGISNADYKVIFTDSRYVIPDAPANNIFSSCKEILNNGQSTGNGIYSITVEEHDLNAYCDMETEGGGWTLVLDYLHKANTDPQLNPMTNKLPIMSTLSFGSDGSNNIDSWGHAAPELFSKFNPSEVLFQCRSSSHNRDINFKSTNQTLISYFSTGIGGIGQDIAFTNYSKLPNHNGLIPDSVNAGFEDKGLFAMTDFPFYEIGHAHWGISGDGGISQERWECDDFPENASNDTLHRIWVR